MWQFLDFFVSNAYAADATGAAQNPAQPAGGYSFIIMLAVFFFFIYFAVWRPQNKRAKETRALLDSLTKGDEVITAGGLAGRIVKLSGAYVTLTVANNVDIILQKTSIVTVLPKGTLKTIE